MQLQAGMFKSWYPPNTRLDFLKTYKCTPNILTLLGYILAVRIHKGEQQTLAPRGVQVLNLDQGLFQLDRGIKKC
jgi:hypothetical protein